jgi:phosphoribosylcarboxyaminoimidazole (NCAIR) mutase
MNDVTRLRSEPSTDQTFVGIVFGSASDWPVLPGPTDMLEQYQIAYEVTISSADRRLRSVSLEARAG